MRKNQTAKGRPPKPAKERAVKVSLSLKPERYAWLLRVMKQKDCTLARAVHEAMTSEFERRHHKEYAN